ncbi:MAG TPA: hypothetical protein VGB67_01520, partial [Fibrella sp.]
MAVYNYLQPLTQYADLPEFQQPSWFRKRNGESTMFGNVFNAAVPALTTIAGTMIGGPAGTAIGAAAGQAIVGGVNKINSKEAGRQGADDAQANIDASLPNDMAMASLTSGLASMVGMMPGANGQSAKLKLNPMEPGALPGMVGSALSAFGPRPNVATPRGIVYRTYAEGGAPGRPSRRRMTLADLKGVDAAPATTTPSVQTPEQAVAAGSNFTQNWYQTKVNNSMSGLTPADQGIVDGIADARYSPTGNFVTKNNEGSFIDSATVPSLGMSFVNGQAVKRNWGTNYQQGLQSNAAHETNHDAQAEMGANRLGIFKTVNPAHPAWQSSEDVINQELQRANTPQIGTPENDAYLRKPIEVHSSVMQLREENGFKPGQVITDQDIDRLQQTPTYRRMFRTLDRQGIKNVLNKTVSNDRPQTEMTQFAAAEGGKPIASTGKVDTGSQRYRDLKFNRMLNNRVHDEMFALSGAQTGGNAPAVDNSARDAREAELVAQQASQPTVYTNTARQQRKIDRRQLLADKGSQYTANWFNSKQEGRDLGFVPTKVVGQEELYGRFGTTTRGALAGFYDPQTQLSYANSRIGHEVEGTAAHETAHMGQDLLTREG